MKFPVYRSAAEHLESMEEIDRENDALRATGRPKRNPVLDPPRLVTATRWSLEPFGPEDVPHLVVSCPDWYELIPNRGRTLGLFPNTTEFRAARGFLAHEVVELARARRYGLVVVEPPLRLTVHTALVEVAGTATGHVYGLEPVPASDACGVRVVPNGPLTLDGPAGAKVVDGAPGRRVAVPVGNGAFYSLTAAEVMDRAARRLDGFSEVTA